MKVRVRKSTFFPADSRYLTQLGLIETVKRLQSFSKQYIPRQDTSEVGIVIDAIQAIPQPELFDTMGN